jgi:hypothetical protein
MDSPGRAIEYIISTLKLGNELNSILVGDSWYSSMPLHPRFIVFPAPLGLTSVYLAQFSSFNLFSSAFSSPNAVPSCSASTASCSDEVGSSSDCGLHKPRFSPHFRLQDSDRGPYHIPATCEYVSAFTLYLEVLVYRHSRQTMSGTEYL